MLKPCLWVVVSIGLVGCSVVHSAQAGLPEGTSDLNQYAKPALVRVLFSPESPKQGENIKAFIEPAMPFSSPDKVRVLLKGAVDGQPVGILAPSSGMWVALLGPYSDTLSHKLAIETWLEDADQAASIRTRLTKLDSEIADFQNAVNAELDPAKKVTLQAELALKQAEVRQLRNALAATSTRVGADEFTFGVAASTDLKALSTNITRTQNRMLLIQNDDGGFPWDGTPDSHLDTSTPSYSNQFGEEGIALLGSYEVTHEPLVLSACKRIAGAVSRGAIDLTHRHFSSDIEFLTRATETMGFQSYAATAQQMYKVQKDFDAAVAILGVANVTNSAVMALPQSQLDQVNAVDRVSALRSRMIAAGRGAGLRAYDFESRLRNSLQQGDTARSRAIADVVAADYAAISANENYYLLGLASTVLSMNLVRGMDAKYGSVADAALAQLLPCQDMDDGFFKVVASGGNPEGSYQDQGFIVRALLAADQMQPLAKLLSAVYGAQLSWGGYDYGDGSEEVEATSDLMWGLAEVWKRDAGGTVSGSSLKSVSSGKLRSRARPASRFL